MKRELVVFAVIGGLLWAATGFSVLAVTFFENGHQGSMQDQNVIGDSHPGLFLADAKSRDEETSAPLCETSFSDSSQPHAPQDTDLRSADAGLAGDEAGRCWQHKAVSLLRFCLFLT